MNFLTFTDNALDLLINSQLGAGLILGVGMLVWSITYYNISKVDNLKQNSKFDNVLSATFLCLFFVSMLLLVVALSALIAGLILQAVGVI